MPEPSRSPSRRSMTLLSRLVLPLESGSARAHALAAEGESDFATIDEDQFRELAALAHSNHVVLRALGAFAQLQRVRGDERRAEWAEAAMEEERGRIAHALPFLHRICSAFRAAGLDITVMKSVDHWPDLGSDLDLYSGASPQAVIGLMQQEFGATLAPRSWGDRLAQKWNFEVPGLPESVEFHVGRLGQTGEQIVLSSRLPRRSRLVSIENYEFPVPHSSDRLMISVLQRMYRHFYFRLCDIVNSATLVRAGAVDFEDLRRSASDAGIWEGVATYLVIVSDYLVQYGDQPLELPPPVRDAARFGGECVYYAKQFLRVPVLPQSARLYATQYLHLLGKGALASSARLSLLPWLATVALVEHKRTGSDKGIW